MDRKFMTRAISEARKCAAEDSEPRPKVAAIAVLNGRVMATAFRGELSPGEHAEYTLLERKLRDDLLAGATIYTTLEPCTKRNHPKIPCASRLVARRVARVVVGMLDPNQTITGKGILLLRRAGIIVDLFPADLMAQLEDLNREFIRAHDVSVTSPPAPKPGSSEQLSPLYTFSRDQYYYEATFSLHKRTLAVRTDSSLTSLIRSHTDGLSFTKHYIRDEENRAQRYDEFLAKLDSFNRPDGGSVHLEVTKTTNSSCAWRAIFEPRLRLGQTAEYKMIWSHLGARFLSYEDMQLAKATGMLPPDRNHENLTRLTSVPCSHFSAALQFPPGYEITGVDFGVTTGGYTNEREKERILRKGEFVASPSYSDTGWRLQFKTNDADPASVYGFHWVPPKISSMKATRFLTASQARKVQQRVTDATKQL